VTLSGSDKPGLAAPYNVSIIMPVLNEAKIIQDAIAAVRKVRGRHELIIVDGGSDDGTIDLTQSAISIDQRCRLISSSPGRGNQLNAGAGIATGRALLFLHADTRLPDSAVESIEQALQEPETVGGNFKLQFEGSERSSVIFTRLDTIRRWFGIYYGDSAIWARRETFENIGGFTSAGLMEDYELCRRLEKAGRTVCFDGPVVSSARRWRDNGVLKTLLSWIFIQWLYLLGVSPVYLARLYYSDRFRFPGSK
jgi:rSAM/selenodomain-associated transferase 2